VYKISAKLLQKTTGYSFFEKNTMYSIAVMVYGMLAAYNYINY